MGREIILRLVRASRLHAGLVLAAALILAAAAAIWAPRHLGMDTDVTKLLSADLPWRQREIAFDAAFPQNANPLAIVVDGATPELAEHATAQLAERLSAAPEFFRTVRRPDGGPFFDRNGLLFLPVEEVEKTTEQIVNAQPLIGPLAADPTLRGLFDALSTVLEGVKEKQIAFSDIERPIEGIAETAEAAESGVMRPMSWASLLTGLKPRPEQLRRFILAQPVMDYASLTPGAAASNFVRQTAKSLGLTPENGVRVRLTGPVALSDEEFASVLQGMGVSASLSVSGVVLLLFLALRSFKLISGILITLVIGLILTAGFAALAVGTLNLISVAFAVLFWGIAVDFGIQFAVAYRQARYELVDSNQALDAAAFRVGPALAVAAVTTAVGFLCFLPTSYRGVSELGLIAGIGMLIALMLNLTVLPSLYAIFKPSGEPAHVGFRSLAPIDRFLQRRRRSVLTIAGLAAIASAILSSQLEFDFNPIDIKDPNTESVSTLLDLMRDPITPLNFVDVLSPSIADATAMAKRLDALPQVERTVTINTYVPPDQDEKLAYIQDAAMILGPTLEPAEVKPPPDDAEIVSAMRSLSAKLLSAAPNEAAARRLAVDLSRGAEQDAGMRQRLRAALIPGLVETLSMLRSQLSAQKVTFADLPQSLKDAWVAKDGRARIEVFPKGNANDNTVLRRFVQAVLKVAPDATGTPISIQESSRTIVNAFIKAGLLALGAITIILALILRNARDVLMVLAPLLLAGALTLGTCVAIGLPLNFANIIALPLLFGIGVAFSIYFVMAWRRGATDLLQSSLTRAVIFSAAATSSAFGGLALSSHKGTAEMGFLLTLSLGYTLLCALFFLPALLGPPKLDQEQSQQPRPEQQ